MKSSTIFSKCKINFKKPKQEDISKLIQFQKSFFYNFPSKVLKKLAKKSKLHV